MSQGGRLLSPAVPNVQYWFSEKRKMLSKTVLIMQKLKLYHFNRFINGKELPTGFKATGLSYESYFPSLHK